MAAVARQFDQPLMPWQQLVADVGLELDPDSGLPCYREVVVTVPRQSGKTTLVLGFEVQRALLWAARLGKPQRIAYTAQTGWDARKKLIDDQAPVLTGSPVRAAVARVLRGVGNESITWKNGSRIDVLASSESAGHGRTLDLGVIDEAFSDVDDRREQAILPTMSTKPAAQMLVVSTAGTEASVYLRRKVDAGRKGVDTGARTGIAYFEWSATDDDDIDDPDTWWRTMPALGRTISVDVVRHARATMSEGDFRRSYLNQWTVGDERVIPSAAWAAVCAGDVTPDGQLSIGMDVNPERTFGSVAMADSTGRGELIKRQPGVGWIVDYTASKARKYSADVAVDANGPAGYLADELEAQGVTVHRYGGREMAYACAGFYDAVIDRKVRIRLHEDLELASAGARKRMTGDAWTWARRDTSCDVSPLVALTVATARALGATAAPVTPWAAWG